MDSLNFRRKIIYFLDFTQRKTLGFLRGRFMFLKLGNSRGGVALEYLMVTVFASVMAFGLMAASSRWMKKKIHSELSKMGVESSEEDLDFLNGWHGP